MKCNTIQMRQRMNAARQAERRFLRERETRQNDVRKATAEVFAMCILIALYDQYGVGEARLQRVADAANKRSERYEQMKNGVPRLVDGKKRTGPELAEIELERETTGIFPADFLLPIHRMPKKRNDAEIYAQRMAAKTVGRLYAYGMSQALGFGAQRIGSVIDGATDNYRHFRERADEGDYFGYDLLARKLSQILRSPCTVQDGGAKAPVFGETLD